MTNAASVAGARARSPAASQIHRPAKYASTVPVIVKYENQRTASACPGALA